MTGAILEFSDVPMALLAGGLGTRVAGISPSVPKALFEVAGSPFIAHQLGLLHRNGIRRVVICTGYLGDAIEAYVGDGMRFGLDVQYSRDGEQLLGTGGALKKAEALLGTLFWVMYGDTYLDVNFRKIFDTLQGSSALGLMTVFRNENRFDRSNVVFRDGRILAYHKREHRPDMMHIDYGLALLRQDALALVPSGERYDLAALYSELVSRGAMDGFEVHRRFYEIGSPEGLAETQRFFEGRGLSLALEDPK